VDEVVSRMMADRAISNSNRLRTVIRDNILTGRSQAQRHRRHRSGPLERSINQSRDFQIPEAARRADIFDDAFLPPEGRLIRLSKKSADAVSPRHP